MLNRRKRKNKIIFGFLLSGLSWTMGS